MREKNREGQKGTERGKEKVRGREKVEKERKRGGGKEREKVQKS